MTSALTPPLQELLRRLGYETDMGWVAASEFDKVTTHRFALQQARSEISLVGAFCLMHPGEDASVVSTPLVYVSTAPDLTAARENHRRVWSQGLVPFLLIACLDEFILCPGFSYGHDDWEGLVHRYDQTVVKQLPVSAEDPGRLLGSAAELWDLRAVRLRTSLFWRDHSIDVAGRVDRRLLASLEALSDRLITGGEGEIPISPGAANGLIGRFLYIYFLFDRRIIDQSWLSQRGHALALDDRASVWTPDATWRLFDDLDGIFNGSIFPLNDLEKDEIRAQHINLVRRVMKHGSLPLRSGGEQLSFLDFYLGILRTETLSSVYEQFLKNLRSGEQRISGAFYTPPYLVDFMLDRVEEEQPLCDGITVLDPAAGSGVFLVGAYRRMVERARWKQSIDGLPLDELRGLLTRNIFGIERNPDACHVAAFSLYLTLLDYVSPRDLTRVAAGEDPERLFPPLVGKNIQPRDFFDVDRPMTEIPERFSCIVGNPPWQSVDKLESEPAENWRDANRKSAPIGNDQAAELFTWKALDHHLLPGGLLGFLLPAKSFINPTSATFRQTLASRHTVIGAANFAHLRYRLFASARQAVVAAFVRAAPPSRRDLVWIYSPLSISQPLARKEWPWTVVFDRAEVQTMRYETAIGDRRSWFDMFMLRPVDRYIRQFLADQVETEQLASLEILCGTVDARISRGGNSSETGVNRLYLNDAPAKPEDDTSTLFPYAYMSENLLPAEELERVRQSYRHRFGGNVLLIPRNLKHVRIQRLPYGFTSSTIAMFFDKPAADVTEKELRLLEAVRRFLSSQIGHYLVATTGRRWLMDRRNVEPEDVKSLYVPFTHLDDPRIDEVLRASGTELDQSLLRLFGIEGDLQRAIEEFLAFRLGFRDGDVPIVALARPDDHDLGCYRDLMRQRLDGLMGRKGAFEVEIVRNDDLDLAAVSVQFVSRRTGSGEKEHDLASAGEHAIRRYLHSAANSFDDSLSIIQNSSDLVTSVKPLEFYRWTLESAFSDSLHFMRAFSEER